MTSCLEGNMNMGSRPRGITSFTFGVETLCWGMCSEEVYNMQLVLCDLGYLSFEQCDGVYLNVTQTAVMDFQRNNAMLFDVPPNINTTTGNCGPLTKNVLTELWNRRIGSQEDAHSVYLAHGVVID